MTERTRTRWATLAVIVGFIIYETITIVFQFSLFIMGDLIEISFDLLFILLLVFFYDVDALILLVELIPFVDIIPLFVIYMIVKISTAEGSRRPLINMNFNLFKGQEVSGNQGEAIQEESEGEIIEFSSEDKVYYADTNEEVCVICMQELQEGDEIITCENDHLAHVKHIQPWTEKREFCPICRIKYPKVLISKTYHKKL